MEYVQAVIFNCLQRLQLNIKTPIASNHLVYMSSIGNLQNYIMSIFSQMINHFPQGETYLHQVKYLLLILDSNNFIRQTQAYKLNIINLQQIQLILFSAIQVTRESETYIHGLETHYRFVS